MVAGRMRWVSVPIGVLLAPLAGGGLAESRGPTARLDLAGSTCPSRGTVVRLGACGQGGAR